MIPQVDTADQARHIVSAAKFGARVNGTRSAPPCRWLPGIGDVTINKNLSFHENLNRQAAIVIQTETLQGIKNLDAILTECGDQIDSCWLGSLDARISMGLPSFWGDEPEWLEAVALYESTLAKYNKPASGLALGSPEEKISMARGRSCIVTGCDVFALMGQMEDLQFARGNFVKQDFKGVYKQL